MKREFPQESGWVENYTEDDNFIKISDFQLRLAICQKPIQTKEMPLSKQIIYVQSNSSSQILTFWYIKLTLANLQVLIDF